MRPLHTFLYCVTVLAIEYAGLALALIVHQALTKGAMYFKPDALYGPGSLVTTALTVAFLPIAARALFGQVPVSVVAHLFVLSRLRGRGEVLFGSLVINAATCIVFGLVLLVAGPGLVMFFDPTSQSGIIGLGTLGGSLLAPVLALRLWQRALLPAPVKVAASP